MANLIKIRQLVKEIVDLSSKSAILADPKSKVFCAEYSKLNRTPESSKFFDLLAQDFGFRNERLHETLSSVVHSSPTPQDLKKSLKPVTYEKLKTSLKPQYYGLFQNLARVKDGVHTLVKIRHDLLDLLEAHKKSAANFEHEDQLKIMNSVLKSLLGLWFSTGLLDIQRIDWTSPAVLVEKVAYYESVHRIRSLGDLKTRLSESRRCFIYTHSTLPYEPLVILHVALTNSISSSIDALVRSYNKPDTNAGEFDPDKCTNAIFYSITSCQKGLQQVELGNSLIKSCVRLLIHELPNLNQFHTLSPIPKFKEWLDLKLNFAANSDHADEKLIEKFLLADELEFLKQSNTNVSIADSIKSHINSKSFKDHVNTSYNNGNAQLDDKLDQVAANFLQRACAYYLYAVKKNGFAFNSVTNFHIKNGAQIYRINFGGDLSDHGWSSSYSLMVNYGYYLDDVNNNCVNYLTNKNIKISDHVRKLLLF